jgi:outer membrane usher protein
MQLGGYDNQVTFNASLPLGNSPHTPSISFNLNHDTNNGSQEQATVNGTLGQWSQFTYGASASHSSNDTGSAYSVNGGYNSPYAMLNASVGNGSGYSQASFSASGAVVAHAGGITFGQPTGDTIAIVHAPGAAGAHLLSAPGLTVDHAGYALVPYLMPYQLDTIQIDPQGLPLGVELDATSADVAPYAGAVVMVNFKSKISHALIARIHLADGKLAPFGAQVFDAEGESLGVVGQGGLTLVRGIAQKGRLSVQWQDTQEATQACSFAYAVPASNQLTRLPPTIDITCSASGRTTPTQSVGAP